MADQPIPLMPDDEQPKSVLFEDDEPEEWQPYVYVAIFAGLALLLVLSFLLPLLDDTLKPWLRFNLTIIAILGIYLVLTILHPRINLLAVCICGAILAMWYGMPATLLYQTRLSVDGFATLLGLTVAAALAGLIFGRFLHVEQAPKQVIPITFLLLFVTASLYSLLYPYLSR